MPSTHNCTLRFIWSLAVTLVLLGSLPAAAQDSSRRPIPYPVTPSIEFQQAIASGTRSAHGAPGPNYWTNTAHYTIQATLSPTTRTLRAHEQITYTNNSPDSLHYLVLNLRQNLHRAGAIRNRSVEITGGMHLSQVTVENVPLIEHRSRGSVGLDTGYIIDGTIMYITPPEPVPPGSSVDLSFAWNFLVPEAGAPRMGHENRRVYFLGYWYPQMAVYDDVQGWDTDPYMGDGEFYMGYADYDVHLTVPQGWLVAATGTLQNANEVLTETVRRRLLQAADRDSVVTIVAADEREAGVSTQSSPTGQLTWYYHADNVRDFAISTSDRYIWDATRAQVDGETVMIHALYRPNATTWTRSAEFARFAVEHLSDMLIPYPYPQMTCVEGILGGGMEYPMITLMGDAGSPHSLFEVTYHEISHMWFPMLVGTQEANYTWMDEGLTSFNTKEGMDAFFEGARPWNPIRQYYYYVAGTRNDVPPMRHADRYPVYGPARTIASYNKPAVALHALRGLVGEEAFFKAYRTFTRRWQYKHPYPHDFFNTFEDVLERELDWFWTSLFYESWIMDHAITGVKQTSGNVTITIRDKGQMPMPILLKAVYADGSVETKRVPVDVWLEGARKTTVTLPAGNLSRVQLDPKGFLPDINRVNNTWTGGS